MEFVKPTKFKPGEPVDICLELSTRPIDYLGQVFEFSQDPNYPIPDHQGLYMVVEITIECYVLVSVLRGVSRGPVMSESYEHLRNFDSSISNKVYEGGKVIRNLFLHLGPLPQIVYRGHVTELPVIFAEKQLVGQ